MADPQETPSAAAPVVWVISTGTEILQGHYADRNAPWLSAELLTMGLSTQRHMALPDDLGRLREGLGEAARQADLVITTGGLGPTVDDLNRDAIKEIWGVELEEDAQAWERIEERFARRGRPVAASNRVQALIPRGAAALQNDRGTAPGFFLPSVPGGPRASLLALPGPPREMQPMFLEQAAPLILTHFGRGRARLRILTFHTIGLAESRVNETVKDLFGRDPRVNFALLATPGRVDIRLTLMGENEEANAALAQTWRALVHERVGVEPVFGENGVSLEEAVGRLLAAKHQTVAVAESCTGGLVAARLTNISGSSDYFREGFVTYANAAKISRLGVEGRLLTHYGAVSPQVAAAMADGARRTARTDWAVSVTGVAGPTGGSVDKPVGLVYFGLAAPDGSPRCVRQQFIGDREDVRTQAAQTALEVLRRGLLGYAFEGEVPFDER